MPSPARGDAPPSACELKGTALPLTLLRLLTPDAARVEQELEARLAASAEYFANSPIVIDASALPSELDPAVLQASLRLLRRHGLVPVGVSSPREADRHAGAAAGLAVFAAGRPRPVPGAAQANAGSSGTEAERDRQVPRGGRVVAQPVRSGQKVYARDTDLTVVGAVNAGAEVIADGSVHVYGALRGRALAGARGDAGARIFCQSLEAELLSIAGTYRLVEDLPPEVRGRPAQVYLEGGTLVIAAL